MITSDWREEEETRDERNIRIMLMVDNLVDKEVFLAEMRGKGVKLLPAIADDKATAITIQTRRIWEALEKL